MSAPLALLVNGRRSDLEVEPAETLLEVLRERLGLRGAKDGCSEGECGACTVLLDGEPVDSCLLPALAVAGRAVTTVEGLSADDGALGRVQEAFARAGAVQCGFCTPGFVMTVSALLRNDPSPSPDAVREAIAGNICRCTGYRQIVEAVAAAASGSVAAGKSER